MLAYELYLRNKVSTANVPFRGIERPIKKIFVYNAKKIAIDAKTLEEYGSKTSDKYRILQEPLIMPLNTSDFSLLNLPDARTSTNQPNPYVEIRGNLKGTSSGYNLTLSLHKSLNDKENLLQASYDITNDEQEIDADKDINLRIDTQNYRIIRQKREINLFEEYVNSNILTEECMFSADLFSKLAKKFFAFVKEKWNSDTNIRVRKAGLGFSLYILPSRSKIMVVNDGTNNTNDESKDFIDSFGNTVSTYASSSTKAAKFLSFDEKAFSINCKQHTDFYQNIGIGQESLQHIYLPPDQTFDIGGLRWMFLDLSDINQTFKETRRGMLIQLSESYQQLNSKGRTKREKSLLKVICLRSQQAKQEILLDDNLTMERMKRLFSTFDTKNIPFMALEVLIFRDRKVRLWDDYLYGIRAFLTESSIPKSHLISIFTRILRISTNVNEWLKQDKKRDDAIDFFKRTDFCLKTLSRSDGGEIDMSVSENFAYQVGTIARLYVDFKNTVEEESNSLRDILTYSKYDRERLRFVIRRLCLGLSISKAKKDIISQTTEKISQNMPKDEITDDEAFNDYSYFFYKGYFLGGDGTK
jgi:hypothetical protein